MSIPIRRIRDSLLPFRQQLGLPWVYNFSVRWSAGILGLIVLGAGFGNGGRIATFRVHAISGVPNLVIPPSTSPWD